MKAFQSFYEAKARFSSLLNEVSEKKCTIVICRHGVPVADLVPHQAARNPFRVRDTYATFFVKDAKRANSG